MHLTPISLSPATVLTGAAILILSASSQAADQTWLNSGTDFNNAANWNTGVPGSGDRAVFEDSVTVVNPQLNSSVTTGALRFNGAGYTLSSNSPSATLTLTNAATFDNGRPFYVNSTGTNSFDLSIIFGATGSGTQQDVYARGTSTLNFNGSLSGLERVVNFDSADGTVINFGASNNFAGGLSLGGNLGVFNVGHVSALNGGSTLSIGHQNGSTINNTSGSTISPTNYTDIRINGNASIGKVTLGGDNWNLASATFTLAGNREITVNAERVTLGGSVVEDAAGRQFTKDGTGTLELQAASTYTGVTSINSGVLLVNHADALAGGNLRLRRRQVDPELGGILGLGNGDFTRSLGTGAGQVQWSGGGGFLGGGGFAAYGANRAVNLGGASAQVTWGVGGFVADALILGAADADATVDFQNPIDLTSGGSSHKTIKSDNGSAFIDGMVSGVISGGRGLLKTGDGTLALTAANTYAGSSIIEEGTLLVNGSVSSSTTVQSGGALGGSGNVAAISLQAGGAITPGNSIGTLSGTSMTWNGGADASFAQMQFELSNVDNSSDQLDLSGVLTKGSGDFFIFDFLGTGAADQTYTLIAFASSDFDASDFAFTGLAGGLTGEFILNGSSLQFATAVPEPGTFALLAGFCGLTAVMLRRRSAGRG